MRILGVMVVTVLLGIGSACAATINFTDGHSAQGDIIKQDAKSVQVNVDGVTMTYYADEIKDIDGKPFGQASSAPTAQTAPPVPAAVEPEAAVQPPGSASSETAAAPAVDTLDPEKKALILKFIDVFGTRQALTVNFDMMLKQVEKEKPDEARKIRDRVKIDEIIERLLPLYDKHFSADDLKSFIAFYESDEGKKLIHTIPILMKESVKESVKYMQEKFPEVK